MSAGRSVSKRRPAADAQKPGGSATSETSPPETGQAPAPTAPDHAHGLPTVYLHIGTMKSGTSYLQSVLKQNADRARERGVLFPAWNKQVRGAREMRSGGPHPTWDELRSKIVEWPGHAAVLSVEGLSFASESEAAAIVESLHPAPVRIVLTARDIARVLPSAWQTSLKNGYVWTLDEYVRAAMDEGRTGDAAQHFWRRHDIAELVAVWSRALGGAPVDLVTVPPRDASPDLLWQRFASATGLDPDEYDTSNVANANPSLTVAEADLMRRVNAALPSAASRERKIEIRRAFANEILRGSGGKDRPTLPHFATDWAVGYADRLIQQLASSTAVRTTGDLEDLRPVPSTRSAGTGTGAAPAAPSEDGAAMAVRVTAQLLTELSRISGQGGKADGRRRDRPNRKEGNPGGQRRKQRRQRRRARREAAAAGD
jgi:hypothetical protein